MVWTDLLRQSQQHQKLLGLGLNLIFAAVLILKLKQTWILNVAFQPYTKSACF